MSSETHADVLLTLTYFHRTLTCVIVRWIRLSCIPQALLEAFDKTREPSDRAESGYGAIEQSDMNTRFKNERSQRGGKGMWNGRVGQSQEADSGIESDINSSMKWPMILGCLMIVVLLCALVGVRMEQTSAAASGASDLHAWSNTTKPHGPSP